ncbi:hypothetical protein ACIHDR_48560 [Nocardia sp. NPDC052278]|uniref:hypothetical protein n=1 Tax=unclassified Nocardia TaxID=2637762 RepID=UPI0036B1A74D
MDETEGGHAGLIDPNNCNSPRRPGRSHEPDGMHEWDPTSSLYVPRDRFHADEGTRRPPTESSEEEHKSPVEGLLERVAATVSGHQAVARAVFAEYEGVEVTAAKLHWLDGMSEEEAATEMGIDTGHVHRHLLNGARPLLRLMAGAIPRSPDVDSILEYKVIPDPATVVERLGDRPLTHDQMVRYARDVVKRHRQCNLEQVGVSRNDTPIYALVVPGDPTSLIYDRGHSNEQLASGTTQAISTTPQPTHRQCSRMGADAFRSAIASICVGGGRHDRSGRYPRTDTRRRGRRARSGVDRPCVRGGSRCGAVLSSVRASQANAGEPRALNCT